MNDFPTKTREPDEAELVAAKPVADPKPETSATAVVKPRTAVEAVNTPTPAKAKAAKPVAEGVKPAANKALAKARTKATPGAMAKSQVSPAQGDKVPSAAKAPAKAKVVAEGVTPAASKAKPVDEARKAKETKPTGKKPKLVRDSFTFPAADYALIGFLKQRALKVGHDIKKSELLRAGLIVLSSLSDTMLIKTLGGIAKLKPGRPTK